MEAEVEFDEGEEPSFSDPEDFEDDISDQGKVSPRNQPAGFIQAPPSRASCFSPQNQPKHCLFIQRNSNSFLKLFLALPRMFNDELCS